MGVLEIIVLGVALSLDAFAVTISDSIVYNKEPLKRLIMLPVAFGVFQGLMPLLGYFLSGAFADVIERYSGIVSLVILSVIGINMIREGWSARTEDENQTKTANEQDQTSIARARAPKSITIRMVLLQAIATSIDAFAVGISLRAMNVQIVECSMIICVTTFLLSVVALKVGTKFGTLLGDRAQIVGGIVLVLIGIHAML